MISGLGAIGGSPSGNARTDLAGNFDSFLKLLTEQLKNQDPLSPMDSTEFVSQLVQFSSVEQQIAQNSNLEMLIGLQLAASQAGAASYLGREVSADTPLAELSDGQARWTYALPQNADSVRLVVEDTNGKVVFVTDGERGAGAAHNFVWDGKDSSGVQLPHGVYRLSVAALDADGEKIPASIEHRGRVTAVHFDGGEPVLMLGKVGVPLADVLALREVIAPDGA